MEVTESKVFNFNTAIDGQQFGFNIAAPNRAEAAELLRTRLAKIIAELATVESLKKSGNSN